MKNYPLKYQSYLPKAEWFWHEFGSSYEIIMLRWARRVQLVRLAESQNWRCCYCGVVTDIPENGPVKNDATREHVVPKSAKGPDEESNLVMACAECNSHRMSDCAFTYGPKKFKIFSKDLTGKNNGKKS